MWFKALVSVACVAVIAATALWIVQQFYPQYAQWREERAQEEWESTRAGRCAKLIDADEIYQRTGNVTTLPMKFAEFDKAVRECRGLPPR